MTAAATTSPTAAVRASFPTLVVAEVAFAVVNLVGVIALRRLFTGTDWLLPLAAQVVAAHATMAILRRRGVAGGPAAALGAGLGLLVLSWIYAGELTTYGIPTGETFGALTDEIRAAFASFDEVKAPVEAHDGFLIAAAEAIWLTAVIGDWAAFRMRAALEATLPSATLFGVAAVLGADAERGPLTAAWIGAVLFFLLTHRAHRLRDDATWVGDERRQGPRALVVLGAGLAAAATLIAAVVGPKLPGASSEAIVELTDIGDNDPGTRVTVSPLVDIRTRLVDQANVEVFSVRSDVRAYWRLTSLDRFDGLIWSSNGSYGKTAGGLDAGMPTASDRIVATQQFNIAALAQIWLPAAYEPRQVEVPAAVRYDEVSGTLIVDTEIPTSDGAVYGVVSELPVHQPEALATASPLVPQSVIDRYLPLPDEFSPRVRELAQIVTAGATSAYDASLRLQNFFRAEFTYDIDIGPGHSRDAMEFFLFESRRGYCEQFAGTFAAMARSLGIPARVAVGFTPGLADDADPTLYRVRGEHAHAWPEVFLGEYGWVAFEPTPGRGAPFAEQYTGVPEQQVASGQDPTTATTTLSPPSTAATSPTTVPGQSLFPDSDEAPGTTGAGEADSGPNPWPGRLLVAALVVVAVAALYVATMLGLGALRRSRRRDAASTSSAQVALAWDDALRALRLVGVDPRPWETSSQTARRAGQRVPAVAGAMSELAVSIEATTYSPAAPSTEQADAAVARAASIESVVREQVPPKRWWVDLLHPRNLWRGDGSTGYSESRLKRSRILAEDDPR